MQQQQSYLQYITVFTVIIIKVQFLQKLYHKANPKIRGINHLICYFSCYTGLKEDEIEEALRLSGTPLDEVLYCDYCVQFSSFFFPLFWTNTVGYHSFFFPNTKPYLCVKA